jgi:prepilin-type N-terminal cleavage/methylation domain-containing protein
MNELKQRGFTLVELMLVIAIIGILAMIAIPQFANVRRRSLEAMTKANLGMIRSAMSIYYGDTEGVLPSDNLTCLTIGGRYLQKIPKADTVVWHPAGNAVWTGPFQGNAGTADLFQWGYNNLPGTLRYGSLWVNCYHEDIRGNAWWDY